MSSAQNRIASFHRELKLLCARYMVRVEPRLEFEVVGDEVDIASIYPVIMFSDDRSSYEKALQN